MAVAVKNTPETASRRPLNRLAVYSLFGVVFVLGSIGLVFHALPTLWRSYVQIGAGFTNTALMIAVMAVACVGLFVAGNRLLGPTPPAGLRAGIFVGLAGVVGFGLLAVWLGQFLEWLIGAQNTTLGVPLSAAVALGLLALLVRAYFRPTFNARLARLEEQGWFNAVSYKKTQGLRVRRGTMLALLVLAGCGIYTLLEHKTLEFGLPNNNHWQVDVPFTEHSLLLLRDVRFTVPILLAAGALWLAFRIVNFPVFADFLIATEAELNKVSWATRKRLVQDTIVVLTTVVLITIFIFGVDIFWGWGLRTVGVLQMPTKAKPKADEAKW